MIIASVTQANQELRKLHKLLVKRGADNMALERMWPLLELIGNPHQKLKVVHIAGTSGKTSTSYYMSALLQSSGKKIGLTVSPHVDNVTERIQVNGQPISEKDFCERMGIFLDYVYSLEVTPSYFEVIISFAFWFFAQEQVDYVVVETGLGGLFDGTNVVTRSDKVCIITDIGFDHMQILGSDIADIAAQKAGIIHEHNQVYMIEQSHIVMEVIQRRVGEKDAILNIISKQDAERYNKTKQAKLPSFQRRNWQLAEHVFDFISSRDHLQHVNKIDPVSIHIPGRAESTLLRDGTRLILDGAHNGQKVEAFVESFRELYPEQKADILLALKEGKEYQAVLSALQPIAKQLIVTTFSTEQDFPITSQDPHEIAQAARGLLIDAHVIKDATKAFGKLKANPQQIKLVIGSIYLLGVIRSEI